MDRQTAEWLMRDVRVILNEWDVLGVAPGEAAPDDEYDCMVGPLVTLLSKKVTREEMYAYLLQELTGHFGTGVPSEPNLTKTLNKLMELYDSLQS